MQEGVPARIKLLRKLFAKAGVTFSQSQMYEIISRHCGYKTYNAYRADFGCDLMMESVRIYEDAILEVGFHLNEGV